MIPTNFGRSSKPRKDTFYSRDEVKVLSAHKAEYRDQTTPELRKKIIIERILPDIFNHWIQNGAEPLDEEESDRRVKVSLIISTRARFDRIVNRNFWRGSETTGARLLVRKRYTPILK